MLVIVGLVLVDVTVVALVGRRGLGDGRQSDQGDGGGAVEGEVGPHLEAALRLVNFERRGSKHVADEEDGEHSGNSEDVDSRRETDT